MISTQNHLNVGRLTRMPILVALVCNSLAAHLPSGNCRRLTIHDAAHLIFDSGNGAAAEQDSPPSQPARKVVLTDWRMRPKPRLPNSRPIRFRCRATLVFFITCGFRTFENYPIGTFNAHEVNTLIWSAKLRGCRFGSRHNCCAGDATAATARHAP